MSAQRLKVQKIDGKFISVKFEPATEDCSNALQKLVERLNADKSLLTWRIGKAKYEPSLDEKKSAFAVAVKEMMEKKEGEEYIFKNDYQWIAVRRIAIDHGLNEEGRHKEFNILMEKLGLTQLRIKYKLNSITSNIGIGLSYNYYHRKPYYDWKKKEASKRKNSSYISMYNVASAVNNRMDEILTEIEKAKEG